MSRIPKSVVSFGGLFLAVGVLTLAVPRALHAVAEALVQVSNTTENPAITQSVPSQASRLVYLTASLPPNTSSGFFSGGMAYTLPAGQSLVITAVDITPSLECTTGAYLFILIGNNSFGLSSVDNYMMWNLSPPNTGHFTYPSGIVFAPGSSPQIEFRAGNNTSGTCGDDATVNMLGYLTSN
ncbi:MAG: hypothetical protein WBE37_11950 [Bryobacteraceae bacterium]